MVFFTCNACGESLKKAQVDKHVMKCRQCEVLSCIDCGKDFWGDDYKEHNKCISEDQKYGGKGYEAKSNKGDVKQQQWMEKIHEAMNKPGVNPKLKEVLNQVSSYDNVPRKKAKFQNWMQNSLRIFNKALQDQVWEVFAAATSNGPAKPAEEYQTKNNTNGTTAQADQNGAAQPEPDTEPAAPLKEKKKNKRERKEERQQKKKQKKANGHPNSQEEEKQNAEPQEAAVEVSKKQKKKKRKIEEVEEEENSATNGQAVEDVERKSKKSKKASLDDTQTSEVAEDAEEETTEPSSKGKFNWKGTIKAVLRQSPEEGLAMKKLRKKVLAAYYSFSGDGNFRSEEELFSLFNKKVNSNPKFKVIKEKVRLAK